MAWELEGFISHLVTLISCSGEQGCSILDIVNEIKHTLNLAGPRTRSIREPFTDHGIAIIWDWLVARNDVSVGDDRKYNSSPLHDLLATYSKPTQEFGTGSGQKKGRKKNDDSRTMLNDAECSSSTDVIKIYVSENTMWEAITGHPVNYKRVPRSEWLLLLGIASTKSQGILQGDLGRLVEQDKRSVPKRTDALVRKGYIVKRTTLVRGTRTSKLWLKAFAPPLPKEVDDQKLEKDAEIQFSYQTLAANLSQVPWHTKWTGDSMDSYALATTIMAVAKEWQVIRLQDLKAKLGVLGMRWQMKTVSKICRFLSSCGAIEYVAAKLDDKVFKDCIKYSRELNSKDWSAFLATGKRGLKPVKTALLGVAEKKDSDYPMDLVQANGSSVRGCSPWKLDFPLPQKIAKSALSSGSAGLTNPDIYALTLGPTFNRFISSLTSCMASSTVQPPHLQHLQLRSEHVRSGKVASYRFFIPKPSREHGDLYDHNSGQGSNDLTASSRTSYGFSLLSAEPRFLEEKLALSNICGLSKTDKRRKIQKSRAERQHEASKSASKSESVLKEYTSQDQLPVEPPGTEMDTEHNVPLIITLRISGDALRGLLTSNSNSLAEVVTPEAVQCNTLDADAMAAASTSKQGKPHGKGRGRPSLTKLKSQGQESRPWRCDTCGGSWKNDIGLKYHLEKSKTPCNQSYEPPPESASPGGERSKSLNPESIVTPARDRSSRLKKRDDARKEMPNIMPIQNEGAGEPENAKQDIKSRKRSRKRSTDLVATRTKLPDLAPGSSSPRLIKSLRRQSSHLEHAVVSAGRNAGQKLLLISPYDRQNSVTHSQDHRLSVAKTSVPGHRAASLHTDSPSTGNGSKAADYDIGPLIPDCHPDNDKGKCVDDRLKPSKAKQRHEHPKIRHLIENLIHTHKGVLLGGKPLWDSISHLWEKEAFGLPVPSKTEFQVTINQLLKTKAVSEHWHVFRDLSGSFSKCQLLLLPGVDAFSDDAMDLLESIKRSQNVSLQESRGNLPAIPNFPEAKIEKRGRRLLAKEVAVLHAPVYAAQVAAKREPVPESRGQMSNSDARFHHSTKRRKTLNHAPTKSLPRMRERLQSKSRGTIDIAPATSVRFLQPNTFLGQEEPSDSYLPEENSGHGHRTLEAETSGFRDASPSHITSDEPFARISRVAIGRDGLWPSYGCNFFEDACGSITMKGWMPDPVWFAWEGFPQMLAEKYACLPNDRKHIHSVPTASHRDLMAGLQACSAVESTWVQSNRRLAVPHNIFINFCGGHDAVGALPVFPKKLEWLVDKQLIQQSIEVSSLSMQDDDNSLSCDDDLGFPQSFLTAEDSDRSSSYAADHATSQVAKPKYVALVSRSLTSLRSRQLALNEEVEIEDEVYPFDRPDELMAAFIVIRTLMGGADKAVDWGLLMAIFPDASLKNLRKFWLNAKKDRGPYIAHLTRAFQERLVPALEQQELAMIDFDNPQAYDWQKMFHWAMAIPQWESFRVPTSRGHLDNSFSLENVNGSGDDWRERFFHPQASVLSRFEAVTSVPGALAVHRDIDAERPSNLITKLDIAKSWIKALCGTSEGRYSVETIRDKFVTLSPDDTRATSTLLKEAITQLTKQRVICRSKKPPLGGRPYRFNEVYSSVFSKMSQTAKYDEAAELKSKLDAAFRATGRWTLPYTLTDGAVMALTNLNAGGRIRLVATDLPNIPFGFEPGNYESRKFSKSYYHFGLQAVPETSYLYNQELDVLQTARNVSPPSSGESGELPQWADFFGEVNRERWSNIVGATCFAMATRGSMSIEGICSALSPVLDEFEARLVLDWGKRVGVLQDFADEVGFMVGEWWWLAVPWLRVPET